MVALTDKQNRTFASESAGDGEVAGPSRAMNNNNNNNVADGSESTSDTGGDKFETEKCVICNKEIKLSLNVNPLLLPCFHTVCSQNCLDMYSKPAKQPVKDGTNNGFGGAKDPACPKCHGVFKPSEVAINININLKAKLEKEGIASCETRGCENDRDAAVFCVSCEAFCCSSCYEKHRLNEMTAKHRFVSVTKGLLIRKPVKSVDCELHQELLTAFCAHDDAILCETCKKSGIHDDHPIMKISDKANGYRDLLETYKTELREIKEHFERKAAKYKNDIDLTFRKRKLELVKEARIRIIDLVDILTQLELEFRKSHAATSVFVGKKLNLLRCLAESFILQAEQILKTIQDFVTSEDEVLIRSARNALEERVKLLKKHFNIMEVLEKEEDFELVFLPKEHSLKMINKYMKRLFTIVPRTQLNGKSRSFHVPKPITRRASNKPNQVRKTEPSRPCEKPKKSPRTVKVKPQDKKIAAKATSLNAENVAITIPDNVSLPGSEESVFAGPDNSTAPKMVTIAAEIMKTGESEVSSNSKSSVSAFQKSIPADSQSDKGEGTMSRQEEDNPQVAPSTEHIELPLETSVKKTSTEQVELLIHSLPVQVENLKPEDEMQLPSSFIHPLPSVEVENRKPEYGMPSLTVENFEISKNVEALVGDELHSMRPPRKRRGRGSSTGGREIGMFALTPPKRSARIANNKAKELTAKAEETKVASIEPKPVKKRGRFGIKSSMDTSSIMHSIATAPSSVFEDFDRQFRLENEKVNTGRKRNASSGFGQVNQEKSKGTKLAKLERQDKPVPVASIRMRSGSVDTPPVLTPETKETIEQAASVDPAPNPSTPSVDILNSPKLPGKGRRQKASRKSSTKNQGVSFDEDQMKITHEDPNEDYCGVCRDGGTEVMICCDVCPKVFHTMCHLPIVNGIPEDNWQCNICKTKEQLLEEWNSFENIANSLCNEEPQIKSGNRKVDVYSIPKCSLAKRDFILACKLLCEIYRCPGIPVLLTYFERFYTVKETTESPEHLNAIRIKLTGTGNGEGFINSVDELIFLIRKMFQQAKDLYREHDHWLQIVLQIEDQFNNFLPNYFPQPSETADNGNVPECT